MSKSKAKLIKEAKAALDSAIQILASAGDTITYQEAQAAASQAQQANGLLFRLVGTLDLTDQ